MFKVNFPLLLILCFGLCGYCHGNPNPANKPNPITKNESSFEKASRIVESKCKEYSELIYRNVTYFTGTVETRRILNCNQREPFAAGEREAEPKEFPHMAAIGYKSNNSKIKWRCSGTLISERFVLSSALCGQAYRGLKPELVMLGEWNYKSVHDDAKPKYYSIVEHYTHPRFAPPLMNNDILLFKLNATVEFNAYVRPICLSTSFLQTGAKAVTTAFASTVSVERRKGGIIWTYETLMSSLMKATTGIIDGSRCVSYFEGHPFYRNGLDTNTIICAEYKNDEYLCRGSAGAPLQIQTGLCIWSQFGILSTGSAMCEEITDNSEVVYTNVPHYIEWIQGIVWPTDEL